MTLRTVAPLLVLLVLSIAAPVRAASPSDLEPVDRRAELWSCPGGHPASVVTRKVAERIAFGASHEHDASISSAKGLELADGGPYWIVSYPRAASAGELVTTFGGFAFRIDKCVGSVSDWRAWR